MEIKILFCFFLLFQFSSLMIIKEIKSGFGENKFRYFKLGRGYNLDNDYTFFPRIPHFAGTPLLGEDVVIRTFPSEANVYHENTDLTKKMTSELESSCGSSKSSFDKTDVVMLTLIEKDIDNVTSNIIKSIKVDPLSVDFYPHKLTMEQFEEHVQYKIPRENSKYCRSICDNLTRDIQVDPDDYKYLRRNCVKISCPSILEDIDYPKMFAEMEKFIRAMKYLLLIGYSSPTCSFKWLVHWTVLEIDRKTLSLFPKLTGNHYFIVTFIDTKKKRVRTRKIDECRIILN